jgi:hypothetical protein
MLITRKVLTIAAVLALAGAAGSAFAQSSSSSAQSWSSAHPRRAQVNSRLNNQQARITEERKSGQIDKAQAHQLRSEDHSIRKEERTMASTNGGHVTKAEQKSLNQQENQVSKQIGK